jgi:GNAT superfamily N-acetyltransferase
MRFSIRTADLGDAAGMRDVVAEAVETYRVFAPAGWQVPAELVDVADYERVLGDPDYTTRLAQGVGQLAGVMALRSGDQLTISQDGFLPDFHLRHLFVREAYWGTGVASALHAVAIEAIGNAPARLVTPADQTRARRFYEREGWRLVGEVDDRGFGMPIVEYRR